MRDLPPERLVAALRAHGAAAPLAQEIAVAVHKRGVRDLAGLGLSAAKRARLAEAFALEPLLRIETERVAADGTRKLLFRTRAGAAFETVLLQTATGRTLCLSSQAGCALACAFCATGRLSLAAHLTAGEVLESFALAQESAGARVTDVVFMGQGEPLHNYDAVIDAARALNDPRGPCLSKKRITLSTSGLVPAIRRYTDAAHPWRLHFSLHSAVPETRARLMPIETRHPLPELIAAIRDYQERRAVPWVTLQYVALPGVNMDDRHVDALGERLAGLRYILNVIPWNEADTGAGLRAPTWAEVKRFTTALRRLRCPVKIRYSGGKQEGMGCGQLSAETVAAHGTHGHLTAPPGIFTG